jgi:hypothetical protein
MDLRTLRSRPREKRGEYADMIPIPPPGCIHIWRGWGSAANPGPCPTSANLFRMFFFKLTTESSS